MRALKLGVLAIALPAFAASLAGCVRVTTRVDFSLASSGGRTTLDVYVIKPGITINPHASNSDSYSFGFPSGLAHVPASQINAYVVNYQAQPPRFGASGGIDLTIDDSGCEIKVDLSDPDGHALPVNGTHRAVRCGVPHV